MRMWFVALILAALLAIGSVENRSQHRLTLVDGIDARPVASQMSGLPFFGEVSQAFRDAATAIK